ncbi:MAG: PEP-CTERM sorting domain-containing protein [Desulfobacula sp.]|nr:PEP-CTERM sorting domain-containing protein [Desulfobacula sp.]MBU3915395.1 PEP-CTERM sorting domain-containing protein [bacterium]
MLRHLLHTILISLFVVFCNPISSSHATSLDVHDGQLYGAFGVEVDDILYDVTFIDASAMEIWPDMQFTFTTSLSARLASQALLDNVFIGDYDNSPALTFGISYPNWAAVWTPYAIDPTDPTRFYVGEAFNHSTNTMDRVFGAVRPPLSLDLSISSNAVYAEWTAVPEPTTLMLLGVGLLIMTILLRKRNQSSISG